MKYVIQYTGTYTKEVTNLEYTFPKVFNEHIKRFLFGEYPGLILLATFTIKYK